LAFVFVGLFILLDAGLPHLLLLPHKDILQLFQAVGSNQTKMSCAKKTQDTVNAEWNSMAGEWDDLASGYRNSFCKLLFEQTKLDPREERIVVDFGSGTGLLTETLRQLSPSSKFVCVDAAKNMIRIVKEKTRAGEWDNVQAHCVALPKYDSADEEIRTSLGSLMGKVDLVVASSVLSFIPGEDLQTTMKVISELLKPGGLFCHSDWPNSDDHPDGYSTEKARSVYEMAGLEIESTLDTTIGVGRQEGKVFVGVARKP
jgi:predicted TPR repeat methyltransferase